MSKQTAPISSKHLGAFTMYIHDRADGIAKVTLEITDPFIPAVGESVAVRVVEVVREVVER